MLGDFELVLMLERPEERPLRVLVADDSRVMRKLLRAALRELGPMDVVEADNGARARAALVVGAQPNDPRGAWDLVLLDLHMPEVHGRDVLLELRLSPQGRDVPVIVVGARPRAAQSTTRHSRPVQAGASGSPSAGRGSGPQPSSTARTTHVRVMARRSTACESRAETAPH